MAQDIRTVMTQNPVTVEANAALVDAAGLMAEADIGDVLVTEGERLVGIVTDRDITVRGTARGADPLNTTVGDVCSRELTVLEPDQTVDEAELIMRDRGIRRLPVVEDGRPIGVVSLGDFAVQRDRDSVLGEISAAEPKSVAGMSREGVVTLLTTIRDEPAFAAQIAEDASIMTGYDISREEREALLGRDPAALRRLNIEKDLLEAASLIGRANR